jgi:hypothetical protein
VSRSQAARSYVDYQLQHIPPYWEEPKLFEGYVRSFKRRGEDVDES